MTTPISKLNILITASAAGALATYSQVEKKTSDLTASVKGQFGKLAAAIGAGALIGKGIELVKDGLAANESVANLRREFIALTGSAARANALLKELSALEPISPLFDLDGSSGAAARTLFRLGVQVTDVVDTVRDLGAISAATGTPLESLASTFGKLAAGPVTLKKLIATADAGIPIIDALTAKYSLSREELVRMLEDGQIGFTEIRAALNELTSESGGFGQALSQHAESTSGKLEELQRAVGNIGEALAEKLAPAIDGGIDLLSRMAAAIGDLNSESVINAVRIGAMAVAFVGVVTLAGKVVAAIGAIVTALRAYTGAAAIAKSLNPLGAAITAFSVLTGAGVAYIVDQQFKQLESGAAAAAESVQGLGTAIQDTAAESIPEIQELADELESLRKRGAEIEKANRTPLEIVRDTVGELNRLLSVGALSATAYDRALKAAADQFAAATKESESLTESVKTLQGVGAAERGTVAGFSAVQSGARGLAAVAEAADKERRAAELQAKLTREMLAVMRESKVALDKIAGKTPVELKRGTLP